MTSGRDPFGSRRVEMDPEWEALDRRIRDGDIAALGELNERFARAVFGRSPPASLGRLAVRR